MRYFIIDIEHIKSRFKSQIAAQKAIDQLVCNPFVLSEKESLEKFKEVFYAGHRRAQWQESSPLMASEQLSWAQLKKSL